MSDRRTRMCLKIYLGWGIGGAVEVLLAWQGIGDMAITCVGMPSMLLSWNATDGKFI